MIKYILKFILICASILFINNAVAQLGPFFPGPGTGSYSSCSTTGQALLHLDGTNGSTTITDAFGLHTWTANGTTSLSTTWKEFGTASVNFGGNGFTSYISSADNADWDLGSGNWTISFWINYSSVANDGTTGYVLFAQRGGASDIGYSFLHFAGAYTFGYTTNGTTFISLNYTSAISAGVPYFIKITRNGTTVELIINGTSLGTQSIGTDTIFNSTQTLKFGADGVNSGGVNGYIDEILWQKGVTDNSTTVPVAAWCPP